MLYFSWGLLFQSAHSWWHFTSGRFELTRILRIVFLPFLFCLMKKETILIAIGTRLLSNLSKSTTSAGWPTGNSSFIQKCASALFYNDWMYADIFEFSRQTNGWSAPCDVRISTDFLKGQQHRPAGFFGSHSSELNLLEVGFHIL